MVGSQETSWFIHRPSRSASISSAGGQSSFLRTPPDVSFVSAARLRKTREAAPSQEKIFTAKGIFLMFNGINTLTALMFQEMHQKKNVLTKFSDVIFDQEWFRFCFILLQNNLMNSIAAEIKFPAETIQSRVARR